MARRRDTLREDRQTFMGVLCMAAAIDLDQCLTGHSRLPVRTRHSDQRGHPARIKAYGESELAHNKTDRLDAAVIARFCRAHLPPAWTLSATHLRELARRCDALKAVRVQELNRQKSGFASPAVARSIADHATWPGEQIEAIAEEVRQLVKADPTLNRNSALLRGVEPRGSPDIAEFTPKALAAFAGLSSASSIRPKELTRLDAAMTKAPRASKPPVSALARAQTPAAVFPDPGLTILGSTRAFKDAKQGCQERLPPRGLGNESPRGSIWPHF